MSKCGLVSSVAVLLALVPFVVSAQEEESVGGYVYGTYSVCDLAEQWRLDELVENAHAKIYDQAVEDGTIDAWGYLSHHTGGPWRRLMYHMNSTLEEALATTSSLNEKILAEYPRAAAEYSSICSSHDDYVWKYVAGSGDRAIRERGVAGFSVYYVCDNASEERVDELVQEVFAPVYNRHVKAGELVSWGWLEHWIGGKYRRLATMSAADTASVVKARDKIIAELIEKHGDAMEEFSKLCGSHQDYIWDIVMERP